MRRRIRVAAARARPVRLLYLMHVDWHWVRQRPHALADELSQMDGFTLLVAYLPNWRRGRLGRNPSTVRRVPIPQLPFGGRLAAIQMLNGWLARQFLGLIGRIWHPDAVLVPFPTIFEVLPPNLLAQPLVYDCMDLASGFAGDAPSRERLSRSERVLAERSSAVVVSSDFLATAMQAILPNGRLPILIRNGAQPPATLPHRVTAPVSGESVRLAYYGTISVWLNLGILTKLLDAEPDVEVHLWGPSDIDLPRHARLIWHGVIPHRELPAAVARAHALIMPFVTSDLTRGVDPVKLYEYVALRRPVISVYYPELDQFQGLVHFYSTLDDLRGLVGRLRTDPHDLAPDEGRAAEFLATSSWRARAEQMAEVVRDVLASRRQPADRRHGPEL